MTSLEGLSAGAQRVMNQLPDYLQTDIRNALPTGTENPAEKRGREVFLEKAETIQNIAIAVFTAIALLTAVVFTPTSWAGIACYTGFFGYFGYNGYKVSSNVKDGIEFLTYKNIGDTFKASCDAFDALDEKFHDDYRENVRIGLNLTLNGTIGLKFFAKPLLMELFGRKRS